MGKCFLFGSEAVKFVENNSVKKLAKHIKQNKFNDIWSIHEFKDPVTLLNCYSGWEMFMVLSKKEYKKLNQLT